MSEQNCSIFTLLLGQDAALTPNLLVYGTIGAYAFQRTSYYRFFRSYKILFFAFFVYMRLTSRVGEESLSILEVVNQGLIALREMIPDWLVYLIGDLLGLILLIKIIDSLNDSSSLNLRLIKKIAFDSVFSMIKDLSFVKAILEKEQIKLEESFDKELKVRSRALGQTNFELPQRGFQKNEILTLMKSATKEEDKVWENGFVSGAVYNGQHDHIQFLNECFNYYSISNPLHPDIWPSVMKFESEIISMTASLVKGNVSTICGSTTSGGTESIILAIKAHRDYYLSKYNISKPELICAISAHAAVDKACDMMNIKLIKVDVDPNTFRIDLNAVRKLIGPNTIMMYASAPSYPHGAIDPISEMSELAIEFNIGLHVDCCLGGFILPFAKKAGFSVPDFDFNLPGVTSMSLDTHKYGYALKGTSVVLYRNKELRHSQYFCYADWTGGMYTTPTIAGSRSGGLIAQCWASMMTLGLEGYLKHTTDIYNVTHQIAKGLKDIPELKILGGVDAMIVCIASKNKSGVDIYTVGDKMHKRGWSLNALQNPPSIHLCCTVTHVNKGDRFIQDLKDVVNEIKSNPHEKKSGNAAIYGMTSSLPSGPVNELLKVYNDVVLKC